MNRFPLKWMVLAGALLAPAVTCAQISCTREGLKTATELYIAAQTTGYARPKSAPITDSAVAPGFHFFLGDLPISGRLSYVDNFDTTSPGHLISKPLKIDRHLSLLDTARCETFTEVLVSDKASPYAFGTRLHVNNGVVAEIEVVWSTTGYQGFDIDSYLKNSSAEDWGTIPPAERDTRATLESAANAYLDALLAGKADVMPWGFPCNRTAADGPCQAGVPMGTVNIANRHFVVDEAIGAVAVFCTFGADPASGRIRTPDAHLFRVENGKVRFVHALTHLLDAPDAGQAKVPTSAKGPAPQN
jgi:hypothetical protein